MAICHALESAKSATDLGAMPNSCRAGLASGASFGTIVDNEGAGHVLGDVEDGIYPYCFPCYFGTRERLGQTGKMYIKENVTSIKRRGSRIMIKQHEGNKLRFAIEI